MSLTTFHLAPSQWRIVAESPTAHAFDGPSLHTPSMIRTVFVLAGGASTVQPVPLNRARKRFHPTAKALVGDVMITSRKSGS